MGRGRKGKKQEEKEQSQRQKPLGQQQSRDGEGGGGREGQEGQAEGAAELGDSRGNCSTCDTHSQALDPSLCSVMNFFDFSSESLMG